MKFTINGHTVTTRRNRAFDTSTHNQYRFFLTTAAGIKLFGKQSDLIGLSRYYTKNVQTDLKNLALSAVTIQEADTDEAYFADYTPAEIEWIRSVECDQLGYERADG